MRPTLQLAHTSYPTVFAIGDVADTKNQKAARRAVQHAHVVAENIARLASANSDVALSEYSQVPWRICMSLGLVSPSSGCLLHTLGDLELIVMCNADSGVTL